jgi:hypothetical protein
MRCSVKKALGYELYDEIAKLKDKNVHEPMIYKVPEESLYYIVILGDYHDDSYSELEIDIFKWIALKEKIFELFDLGGDE